MAAQAHWPLHGSGGADFFRPLRRDFAEVVGEDEGGAAGVCPAHDGDFHARQLQGGIGGADGRVIPGGDLAQVDVCEGLAAEFQLAIGDAGQIGDDHHAAGEHGELHEAVCKGAALEDQGGNEANTQSQAHQGQEGLVAGGFGGDVGRDRFLAKGPVEALTGRTRTRQNQGQAGQFPQRSLLTRSLAGFAYGLSRAGALCPGAAGAGYEDQGGAADRPGLEVRKALLRQGRYGNICSALA